MRITDEERRLALRHCTVDDLMTLPDELLLDAIEAKGYPRPRKDDWIVTPEEVFKKATWRKVFNPQDLTTMIEVELLWGGVRFHGDFALPNDAAPRGWNLAAVEQAAKLQLSRRTAETIKRTITETARTVEV